MSNQIYSQGNIHIPFSWENKPGISKVEQQDDQCQMDLHRLAPPPPPPLSPPENSKAITPNDMKIPPPPCAFQPIVPAKSSSRRGLKKIEDPFLMAYEVCTKSGKNDRSRCHIEDQGFGLKSNMSLFSCKKSCSVIEDSIVQPTKLLVSRSMREKERN